MHWCHFSKLVATIGAYTHWGAYTHRVLYHVRIGVAVAVVAAFYTTCTTTTLVGLVVGKIVICRLAQY